ncbi:hypothetical protein KOW79_002876 [Hemibagrus wyckioides]|uniref:Uncharacterized protein n=1 Tax=Hemibagrus wyckioides TaxID=337641 RepID=A0A9D3P6I6_9TELE|nr:hypothetical protein KOW79_002876 [Hemibagrus wyckioides]
MPCAPRIIFGSTLTPTLTSTPTSIPTRGPANPPQCVWLPIPTCAPDRGRGGNPPAPSIPQSPSPVQAGSCLPPLGRPPADGAS